MPMPKPNENETEKAFISRFMNDDTMKAEYPNIDQRLAVANKAWKASLLAELEEMSGVEVFRAGSYYGRTYTEADLEDIAKNTNELIAAGKHRAPSKLGHDDNQTFAKLSGLPAVGWVAKVVRKGKSLFADFVGVPKVVKDAIDKNLYNSVSSEIYLPEHSEKEFGVRGMVLRAVAWLGADVPKVKGMAPLSAYFNDHGNEASVAVVAFSTQDPTNPLVETKDASKEKLEPLSEGSKGEPKISNEEPSKPGETGAGKASEEKSKEVTMTEAEIKALQQELETAKAKAAEALKFGETEKQKREALELKAKQDRIAAFCESHKETLTPALQPKFTALALAQSSVVIFDDKEVDTLEVFLGFTEEVLKAKKVDLSEHKEDGEGKDKQPEPTEIQKLEEKYRKSQKDAPEVRNAEFALKVAKYAEDNKVSYKDALLAVSKIKEDK